MAPILIGVRTKRFPNYHQDVVVRATPFQQKLLNPDRYYKTLESWLVPMPEELDIRWWPSAKDPTRGIVDIAIPRQHADRGPILVAKVVEESGKVSGKWMGLFERRGEHTVALTPVGLQHLLRDGQRVGRLTPQLDALTSRGEGLADAIDTLTKQVQLLAQAGPAPPLPAPPPLPPGPSPAVQHYQDRRGAAVTAAGLRGRPMYSLAAVPVEPVSLPTLFKGVDNPLERLLTRPPALRHAGFGVTVRGELEVVRGELRRIVMPSYTLLECWSDGTLIYVTDAANFLCWGDKTKGNTLQINPLALAESTYLFATLAQRVYAEHSVPRPKAVRIELTLERMDVDGKVAVLTPGGVFSMAYRLGMDARRAPSSGMEHAVEVTEPWTPGAVAYKLTAAVFNWFGHTDDKIRYASEEDGVPVISAERILADNELRG